LPGATATCVKSGQPISPLAIPGKYLLNIFFTGDIVAEWLAQEFTFLGVHFQNWMPLALAIVVLAALLQWFRSARGN
jgi:hypothetical protein